MYNNGRLTYESKMIILGKYHMEKSSISALAREWNISTSTVKRIIRSSARSKETETYKTHSTVANRRTSANQCSAINEMEKLLTIWIEDQLQRSIPLTIKDTQAKASNLYDFVERFHPKINLPFIANHEWLTRYRDRARYYDSKMMGEPVFDTLKKAKSFSENLEAIIEREKYDPQQVFNLAKVLLFWKNMPEAEENTGERVTLVLGCNAKGDCKLKPLMVYNTPKLRGVKNCYKPPTHYYYSEHSWITGRIFEEWFLKDFIPETKAYCQKKGIPFKILLILDSTASFRKQLTGLYPNVKVVFFPKCTSQILQPMHQGIMSTFKAYYFAHTLNMVTQATQGNANSMVQSFCESYTIQKGISHIKHAWNAIPKSCLEAAWKRLCPQFGDVSLVPQDITLYLAIKGQILSSASKLGFDMTEQDVESLIQSSGKELSNEDLLLLGRLIDAEEANEEVDLHDEGQSNPSAGDSLLDDDCIDVTDDFSKTNTQEPIEIDDSQSSVTVLPLNQCEIDENRSSVTIPLNQCEGADSHAPLTELPLNQCALNDKNSMDYEACPIDCIKIEDPQLIETTIMNCIPKKIEARENSVFTDNESSQESLILISQANKVNAHQQVEILTHKSKESSEPMFNEEYVKEFKNPNEMPPRMIAEEIELAFDHITCAMEKFESVDANKARFQAVRSAVNDMLACYREMFEEKRHICSPDHKND